MKTKPIYSSPDIAMLCLDCADTVATTSAIMGNENFTIDDGVVDF